MEEWEPCTVGLGSSNTAVLVSGCRVGRCIGKLPLLGWGNEAQHPPER